MLSQETILDFQNLYFKKKGINLSIEDADQMAFELLKFMKLIYKPIKKVERQSEKTFK